MKVNLRNFRLSLLFTLAVLSILSATASAQNKAEAKEKTRSFCSYNSYSNGDHVSVSDTRETTIPATGSLNVDGGQNGGDSGDDQTKIWGRFRPQGGL